MRRYDGTSISTREDATNGLRPDVAACVAAGIAACPRDGTWKDWRAYHVFKDQLSHLCGWDAPSGKYDQAQFDAGIRAWSEGVGL